MVVAGNAWTTAALHCSTPGLCQTQNWLQWVKWSLVTVTPLVVMCTQSFRALKWVSTTGAGRRWEHVPEERDWEELRDERQGKQVSNVRHEAWSGATAFHPAHRPPGTRLFPCVQLWATLWEAQGQISLGFELQPIREKLSVINEAEVWVLKGQICQHDISTGSCLYNVRCLLIKSLLRFSPRGLLKRSSLAPASATRSY